MDLSIACLITLNRYSLLAILGTHLPWNDKRSLTLKLCSSLLFLELLSCVFRTFCSFLLTPVATIHVLTHLVKLQPELFFSVCIRDNTVWQYIYFGTLLPHNCTWVIWEYLFVCSQSILQIAHSSCRIPFLLIGFVTSPWVQNCSPISANETNVHIECSLCCFMTLRPRCLWWENLS